MVAQVKRDKAASGTHAKRRCTKASTMEGFSIWIHLNWREAQTSMRKLVLAQRKVRGRAVAEKKKVI
jgi:hypothetical protein